MERWYCVLLPVAGVHRILNIEILSRFRWNEAASFRSSELPLSKIITRDFTTLRRERASRLERNQFSFVQVWYRQCLVENNWWKKISYVNVLESHCKEETLIFKHVVDSVVRRIFQCDDWQHFLTHYMKHLIKIKRTNCFKSRGFFKRVQAYYCCKIA